MNRIIDYHISNQFSDKDYFSRNHLEGLLSRIDPKISPSALAWRIQDLLKRNVIYTIKLGQYSVSKKPEYQPFISDKVRKLAKVVGKDFQDLNYSIWSTEWLNEFTQHQIGTFFFVLEVEKDYIEEVFNAYSTLRPYRAYLDPNSEIIERYIDNDNCIVIKPIVSRSPLNNIPLGKRTKPKLFVPTLEKILVDIFSDPITFNTIQGHEMMMIFENALKRYQLNFTKLLSYAKRRNKEAQLKQFINDNFTEIINLKI